MPCWKSRKRAPIVSEEILTGVTTASIFRYKEGRIFKFQSMMMLVRQLQSLFQCFAVRALPSSPSAEHLAIQLTTVVVVVVVVVVTLF